MFSWQAQKLPFQPEPLLKLQFNTLLLLHILLSELIK